MARKQMIEGGTKNRIREVGGRQIFEHGYDGTSVRGIMLEVGGEVGLFYYYYKTKDELFTDVLDHFFEPYRKDLEALAAEAKEKGHSRADAHGHRAVYRGHHPHAHDLRREADDGPAHHGHFPRARPGELHPARGCRLGRRGDGRYASHGQPHHGAQRGGVPQNV